MSSTGQTNTRGGWSPAVPEPFHGVFLVTCDCGRGWFTRAGYRGHYALDHIRAEQELRGRPVLIPAYRLQGTSLKKVCPEDGCGRTFWTRAGYRGHYHLVHILHLEEK